MKKIKLREVLLLIIPVVALGVWAWQRHANVRDSNEFRVIIKNVTVEPVTPREIYEGFDTRVVVVHETLPKEFCAKYPNSIMTSSGSRDSRVLEGKEIKTSEKISVSKMSVIGSPEGEKEIFSLRLRDLPASQQDIKLESLFTGGACVIPQQGNKQIYPRPARLSVVVRPAGSKITLPPISRYRPFRLKSMKVQKLTKARFGADDTTVELVIESLDDSIKKFADKCNAGIGKLVDATGKGYNSWPENNPKFFIRSSVSFRGANHQFANSSIAVREFTFPLSTFSSKGRVTFKTEVSYNDGWPLPVEIVVRDK